jgi:RsiW-degrading membrane proteinase PrsW (M82 family)
LKYWNYIFNIDSNKGDDKVRILFYIIISIAFILVTLFGMGPVLFADGKMGERLVTLLVVVLIYLLLGYIVVWFRKHNNGTKE